MGAISRQHPWHQFAHFLSYASSALAAGTESTRLIQELIARQRTASADIVSCPYYETGTDLPTHRLGDVLAPFWHATAITALVFVFIVELPGKYTTARVAKIWEGTGAGKGTWHTGALQFLLAMPIIATTSAVYGTKTTQLINLASGYCLGGVAVLNLVLGMLWQADIREYRHQVDNAEEKDKADATPADDAKDAAKYLELSIMGCHFLRKEDKERIENRLKALREAVGKL